MRVAAAGLLMLLLAGPAAAESCARSQVGEPCTCNLFLLHPLQGGIGMAEVNDKIARIRAKTAQEEKDLEADPIKVARAPNKELYVTDHHHTARAWFEALRLRKAGFDSTCQVTLDMPPPATMPQFVAALRDQGLDHLADASGQPIAFEALPRTLDAMQDDPYRSLAWKLREDKAWCRNPGAVEFAEFTWADYLRTRLRTTAAAAMSPKTVAAAEQLARAPAAKCLPGYVGPATPGFECPATPPPPDPSCPPN